MIIIVEGTDRVGKTTLVDMLHDRMGFIKFKDYLHDLHLINNHHVMAEKLFSTAQLLKAVSKSGINIVVDRFHITEYVYGTLERITSTKVIDDVDEMLYEMGAILVHVMRTNMELSNTLARADQSGHEKFFIMFMATTRCEVLRTDYDNLNSAYLQLIHKLHIEEDHHDCR